MGVDKICFSALLGHDKIQKIAHDHSQFPHHVKLVKIKMQSHCVNLGSPAHYFILKMISFLF